MGASIADPPRNLIAVPINTRQYHICVWLFAYLQKPSIVRMKSGKRVPGNRDDLEIQFVGVAFLLCVYHGG